MAYKVILRTFILLVMSQLLKSDTILLKETSFTGWKIPDLSCFYRDSVIQKKANNNLPVIVIEHYVLKTKERYYLINKKSSENNSGQADLVEKIGSFRRELIDSFDIISLKSDNTLRFYRIYSLSQSDALSYYRTKMDFKKNRLGFEGGIESGGASFYFILDYDDDGIFEIRIWGDTRENIDTDKQFYLILRDYIDKRKTKHNSCIAKISRFKKIWLNFIENPMNDTLKIVYESFPEKKIDIWFEILGKKTKDINSIDMIEKSQELFKSLKKWQEQSLFCEGKAKKEEKLLLNHISKNLHLIFREFIYGNPYAIGIALKLYPVLRNDQALELDNMLVFFCLMRPEKFLEGLKNHSHLIKADQALDRTIGYENIGFLNNAKREIEILLKTIQNVKNKDLDDIKEECINYLVRRQKDLKKE
jgi:hypothetical protein